METCVVLFFSQGIDELNKSNFKNGGINISGFQLLNTTTVKNNNGVLKDWMTFAGKGAGKNEINVSYIMF